MSRVILPHRMPDTKVEAPTEAKNVAHDTVMVIITAVVIACSLVTP